MKKLLLLTFLTIFLTSCGSKSSCEYSHLTLKANVNGKMVNEQKGNDCYSITKEGEGSLTNYTVKGKKTADKFSISYYEEGNKINIDQGEAEVLRFLDIKMGSSKNNWRANKGHQIYKIEKNDTLAFYFSDNSNKAQNISGSIVFYK